MDNPVKPSAEPGTEYYSDVAGYCGRKESLGEKLVDKALGA